MPLLDAVVLDIAVLDADGAFVTRCRRTAWSCAGSAMVEVAGTPRFVRDYADPGDPEGPYWAVKLDAGELAHLALRGLVPYYFPTLAAPTP
jgi:hypothetical protein